MTLQQVWQKSLLTMVHVMTQNMTSRYIFLLEPVRAVVVLNHTQAQGVLKFPSIWIVRLKIRLKWGLISISCSARLASQLKISKLPRLFCFPNLDIHCKLTVTVACLVQVHMDSKSDHYDASDQRAKARLQFWGSKYYLFCISSWVATFKKFRSANHDDLVTPP